MKENQRIILGRNIREARINNRLTIEKLAEKANVSPSGLGIVERGGKGLSIEKILDISNALDVSVDWLLKGTETTDYRINQLTAITKNLNDRQFNTILEIIRTVKNDLAE